MLLDDLLAVVGVKPQGNIMLSGLCLDHRRLQTGNCFIALKGVYSNGAEYIDAAVHAGAVAVLYDTNSTVAPNHSVPMIAVDNLRQKAGLLADAFYGSPSNDLHIVGITGTNGKTTVSHLLAQAQVLLGEQAAVMGTLGVGAVDDLCETGLTTPDAVSVHHYMRKLADEGFGYLNMEASSHALCQHRIGGVQIDTAVFTQLSQDHLDYHGDMQSYAQAKERLLQQPGLKHAVLNADDATGLQWIIDYAPSLQVVAYSRAADSVELPVEGVYLRASEALPGGDGYRLTLETPWGSGECCLHLLGDYNLSNALAVIATLGLQGFSFEKILSVVPKLKSVCGRMQHFAHPKGVSLVVDFAHTPDALQQVLASLQAVCAGRLLCVFGCGGQRDSSKRAQMGQVAADLADAIWITNDNPRTEDPAAIAEAIEAGCAGHAQVQRELDRRTAIESALENAQQGDIILVAGKGHEAVQIVGEQKLPWSDIACVTALCGE